MYNREYQYIRILALDLLIDSRNSKLPIDIRSIARIYNLSFLISDDKSLYENTLNVSKGIMAVFGFGDNPILDKNLAIRLMAPIIVLKELNVKSAADTARITGLPIEEATHRFERYQALQKRNRSYTSSIERKVLSQFRAWIDSISPS